MSERDKQRQHAQLVDEQITALENLLESTQKDLAALKLAREILNEPPRKVTECSLVKHYALVSKVSYTVDCSECHKESFGLDDEWSHCPKCGSVVTEVVREDDPRDRLQDKAAKRLFDKLHQETTHV